MIKKLIILFMILMVAVFAFGQQSSHMANPSIGGKSNGATITKEELLSAGKLLLNQKEKMIKFFIFMYRDSSRQIEFVSNTNALTQEMKKAISSLPSGTQIQFMKIVCISTQNGNAAPERVDKLMLTLK